MQSTEKREQEQTDAESKFLTKICKKITNSLTLWLQDKKQSLTCVFRMWMVFKMYPGSGPLTNADKHVKKRENITVKIQFKDKSGIKRDIFDKI
jgi:hypothetical protein